jgi:hypothetical protein
VKLLPPILTYQQRYLVTLTAAIDCGTLLKDVRVRDLHYVVKVADERGNWFSGQSYGRFAATSACAGRFEVVSNSDVLVRPGTYVIAIIVYDSVHGQSNVWRHQVKAPALKNDPLPQLDRDIPAVYFPEDEPSADRAAVPAMLRGPAGLGLFIKWEKAFGPLGTLGPGISRLPVNNVEPLVIDVVVNLSPGYYFGSEDSNSAYRANANLMLQMGSVLSGLSPAKGCVRFSVLDVLQHTTLLDRSSEIDWLDFRKTVNGVEHEKIDVQTLAAGLKGAVFFRDFLARLTAESQACGLQLGTFQRIVIVVSTGLIFPRGSPVPRLPAEALTRGQVYYLRPQVGSSDLWDQIGGILHPMKPRAFLLTGSLQFRKAIARIISEIEARDSR